MNNTHHPDLKRRDVLVAAAASATAGFLHPSFANTMSTTPPDAPAPPTASVQP